MSEAVRPAAIGEILALRHAILRAGFPLEAANFAGDDEPTTRHFAAIDDGGKVVGCVSMMRADYEGQPAWQLRGMAVATQLQKRGIGGRLLRYAETQCVDPPALWCNARVEAIAFYEKHGWRTVSDVFVVPTAGPHRRMAKRHSGSGFRVPGSG